MTHKLFIMCYYPSGHVEYACFPAHQSECILHPHWPNFSPALIVCHLKCHALAKSGGSFCILSKLTSFFELGEDSGGSNLNFLESKDMMGSNSASTCTGESLKWKDLASTSEAPKPPWSLGQVIYWLLQTIQSVTPHTVLQLMLQLGRVYIVKYQY